MSELKSCPFCDGEASIVTEPVPIIMWNDVPYDSLVHCIGCQVSQSGWAPKQQVIDEWNTRFYNKWISVEDGLPKEECNVLFYVPSQAALIIRVGYIISEEHRGELPDGIKAFWFVDDSENTAYAEKDVTHWMPLPEPPTCQS